MEELVHLQHEQTVTQCTMRLHELKAKREKARLTSRKLCRDTKEALEISVMTSDVFHGLKSFMHELRKTEVALRCLNDKIE